MGTSSPSLPRYCFGPFELDSSTGTLLRNGSRVKLQDLPCRLLLLLLERPGEIVTRDDMRRLWPDNTFVEFDKSLGVAVLKVREALSDEASNPRFVETIPRRGYRFIAPVKIENPQVYATAPITTTPSPLPATPLNRSVRHWWVRAALVLLLVGTMLYFLRPRQRTSPVRAQAVTSLPPIHVRRSVAVLGFRNLPGRTEDNWLSSALCEMLNTELAAGGELRMLPGEDVARAKSELPLSDEDSLGKSTLQRLRTNPGAN